MQDAKVVVRALSQSVVWCLMPLLILVVSVGPGPSQVVGGTVQGTLTDASGAVLARVKASVVNGEDRYAHHHVNEFPRVYSSQPCSWKLRNLDLSDRFCDTSSEGCNGYRRRPVNRKSHAESRNSVRKGRGRFPGDADRFGILGPQQPGEFDHGARTPAQWARLLSTGHSGSVLGSNLGVDAVQEFSVLTSNYSSCLWAERQAGVINAHKVRPKRISRSRLRVHPQQRS